MGIPALAVAIVTLAACGTDVGGDAGPCGPNGTCPSGYSCQPESNRCIRSTATGDAGVVLTFASGEDWPSFDGDLDGPKGESLGNARAVCVSRSVPASCPTDAVTYRPSGAGWAATVTAPGAIWVWRGDVSASALSDLQFAVFEKSFTVGADPSGTIQVAADDFVEVRVNGAVVGSAGSVTDVAAAYAGQAQASTLDLGPGLHPGSNTITIIAQNGPQSFGSCAGPCTFATNTAGVIFGGVIVSH